MTADKIQLLTDGLINFLQIPFVVLGNQHRSDSMTKRCHGFLLQSADSQNTAPNGNLAGHGHIPTDGNACQRGNQGGAHRYARRWTILGNSALGEMDMNILCFIEVWAYPQLLSIGADIAHSSVDGFLHYIAQVASKLQFSGAIHHIDLNFQSFPANSSPGKSCNQPHLICTRKPIWQILTNAQKTFQISTGNRDALGSIRRQQLHIGFPTNLPKTALQVPNTGLPGVAGNNLPDRILRNPKLDFFQTVFLQLLGNQVVFGDHHLFFVSVGAQLNDLHSVKQGPGNGIQCVCSGDKHHIRQVNRNFQVMIPVRTVLFAIEHFQERCAGIPTIIGSHFVNLIQ